MKKIDVLRTRLEQMAEIYRENGNITASFTELARVCDVVLELLSERKEIGFNDRP